MTDKPCPRCSIMPEPGQQVSDEALQKAMRSQMGLDNDRALRLVLATLKADLDDGAARWNLLENELGGCRDCLLGTLTTVAGLYAVSLESDAADVNPDDDAAAKDMAIREVEFMILSGIDERLPGD